MRTLQASHGLLCNKNISEPIQDSVTRYKNEIQGKTYSKYAYFNTEEQVNTITSFCKARNMKAPELKTPQDKIDFQHFIQKYNLHRAAAGIQFDPRVVEFVYDSDKRPIKYALFEKAHIKYNGDKAWSQSWDATLHKDDSWYYHHSYLYYEVWQQGLYLNVQLETLKPHKKNSYYAKGSIQKYPAVCEIVDDHDDLHHDSSYYDSNFKDICNTTAENFKTSVNWVRKYLDQVDPNPSAKLGQEVQEFGITTEDMNTENMNNSTLVRRKRSIIGLTMKTASFFVGAGKLAYFIRKETNNEYDKLKKRIDKNSDKIDSVILTQYELSEKLDRMKATIESLIPNLEKKVLDYSAAVHKETHIKNFFDNIFREAKSSLELLTHLYSMEDFPIHFFLTPNELITLERFYKLNNNVNIDTDYRSIEYSVSRSDKEYHILFTIPIEDPTAYASVYRIHPLPIFHAQQTYIPVPSYPYVGIFHNRDSESFVPLDSIDQQKCFKHKHCDTVTPVYDKDTPLCGVSNYYHKPKECEYKIQNGYSPTFLNIKENTWIISKENLTLYLRCRHYIGGTPPEREIFHVQGVTRIVVPKNCRLQNNNFTVFSRSEISSYNNLYQKEVEVTYEKIDANIPTFINSFKETHESYENKINFDVITTKTDLTWVYVTLGIIAFFTLSHILHALWYYEYINWATIHTILFANNSEQQSQPPTYQENRENRDIDVQIIRRNEYIEEDRTSS